MKNSLHGIGLPNHGKLLGNWYITTHAVQRYRSLYARHSSFQECKVQLIAFSCTARYIKDLHPGIHLYRTGRPQKIPLIVSTRFPCLPQLVTVLKPGCNQHRQVKSKF